MPNKAVAGEVRLLENGQWRAGIDVGEEYLAISCLGLTREDAVRKRDRLLSFIEYETKPVVDGPVDLHHIQLAIDNEDHVSVWAYAPSMHREIGILRARLERLGSSEAFTIPFVIGDNEEGRELKARLAYARGETLTTKFFNQKG